MSFDATCYCPKCKTFWYECADLGETYNCPKCGYRNIEPEELDSFCLDIDEELATIEWVKQVTSQKEKKTTYQITELETQIC